MNIYYLVILTLLISFNQMFSHDNDGSGDGNPVHQRIVVEAYELIKLQLSKEENGFADMDQYIGTAKRYDHEYEWNKISTIACGAEHEDVKDIVYDYGWPNTSSTHFWDVDHMTKNVKLFPWSWFPSAYTKAKRYINDDYDKIIKRPYGGGYQKLWCAPGPNSALYKWYWKESIYVNYSHNVTLGIPHGAQENYIYYNENERGIFFNILGRLCHLLTDMGVPEHARRSIHTRKYCSPYETWQSDKYDTEFYWTAEKVYEERGGFVNPIL